MLKLRASLVCVCVCDVDADERVLVLGLQQLLEYDGRLVVALLGDQLLGTMQQPDHLSRRPDQDVLAPPDGRRRQRHQGVISPRDQVGMSFQRFESAGDGIFQLRP